MNKADFIKEYAAFRDKSKAEAKEDIEAVLEIIKESLSKGKPVKFAGYFGIERVYHAPRRYKNPSSGKIEKTKPKYAVCFKTGKILEEVLNPKDSEGNQK